MQSSPAASAACPILAGMAEGEQLQLLSRDEQADRNQRLAIFRANDIKGIEDHSYDEIITVGKGSSAVRLYSSGNCPALTDFADFSSEFFRGHYTGYGLLLELGRVTCAAHAEPEQYTSAALRETALEVLQYIYSHFVDSEQCSNELSDAFRRALQTRRADEYGSFFEHAKRSDGTSPHFCMLHGSCRTHATSTCRTLAQLREKHPGWDPSENHQLCIELWEASICNPQCLHRQAAIRVQQRQQREQAAAQAQPQAVAATPVTPGRRAGEPLINRPSKRQQPTGHAFMTLREAPAIPAAAAAARQYAPGSSTLRQSQQQQQLLLSTSSAADTAATSAADNISFMVRNTAAENTRSFEHMQQSQGKLEQTLKELADYRAEVAALSVATDQLKHECARLKKEIKWYRQGCTCDARQKAEAARNADD
jgi:hypothetical protein